MDHVNLVIGTILVWALVPLAFSILAACQDGRRVARNNRMIATIVVAIIAALCIRQQVVLDFEYNLANCRVTIDGHAHPARRASMYRGQVTFETFEGEQISSLTGTMTGCR